MTTSRNPHAFALALLLPLAAQAAEPAGISAEIRQLCGQLPAVMASQQELASSVPQFQPCPNPRARHVDDCLADVRHSLASL